MVDWQAWVRAGRIVDGASGIAFLLLGLAMLIVKPRTRLSMVFAVFAIAFGVERDVTAG